MVVDSRGFTEGDTATDTGEGEELDEEQSDVESGDEDTEMMAVDDKPTIQPKTV